MLYLQNIAHTKKHKSSRLAVQKMRTGDTRTHDASHTIISVLINSAKKSRLLIIPLSSA